MVTELNRIKTYIKGFDECIEGGIPERFITLICGKAGSMKSSVAFNILYHHIADKSEKGIYLSLEQGTDTLTTQMEQLGMPAGSIEDLLVMDIGKMKESMIKETELRDGDTEWMDIVLKSVNSLKKSFGCDVLVIDSLNAIYTLSDMERPRAKLYEFMEGLRALNITTFLITEMPGESKVFGGYGVESFLADGIIHLDLKTEEHAIQRYIGLPKMRCTNYVANYFPLMADENGFRIVTE